MSWKVKPRNLVSKFAKDVDANHPLQEYPRPQLVRDSWLNLNGLWDYAIRPRNHDHVDEYDGKILVPFPIESALSGVQRPLKPSERLWYRCTIPAIADGESKRAILHFGAVDWETHVHINNKHVGMNRGGYIPFSFDITDELNHPLEDGNNELVVAAWDPTSKGRQERGKQTLVPWHILYTSVSGIWQTVWLETVPRESHIKNLRIIPDIDKKRVYMAIEPSIIVDGLAARVHVYNGMEIVAQAEIKDFSKQHSLTIDDCHVWSPNDPHLYDVSIDLRVMGTSIDHAESYFGMRKIDVANDASGIPRVRLNNRHIFQIGPLDQGYWPDGLYTAPTDDALRYDIELAKDLGFNMIRKHVKVEPLRWYHHCDKIGMLVWQDMPHGGWWIWGRRNASNRHQYHEELKRMIELLWNEPCIVTWVPFNEGWGQFDTGGVTDTIRALDGTRLIDSASGWFDKQTGDIHSIHAYP